MVKLKQGHYSAPSFKTTAVLVKKKFGTKGRPCGDREEMATYKPGREGSEETNLVDYLAWEF